MQPPPRLDLGNPPQPQQQHSAPPPHFPPPPYREEPQPAPKAKSRIGKLLPTIVTLGAFAGLAVLAWFAYQEGKSPTSEEDVPVIKADQEPFKRAPENPNSEEGTHTDKEVYNSYSSDKPAVDTKKAQAMPDSERPIDRSFLKQFAGKGEDEGSAVKQESVTFGDKKAEAAKPTPAADAPLEAKPLPLAKANEALPTPNTGGIEVVKKMEAAKEEKPAARNVKKAEAAEDEDDAAPAPAQELKKEEVKKTEVKKATVAKPAKPAEKKAATTTTKPAKAATVRLQLGAYKSDAEATKEWKKTYAKHKALFKGLTMMVQKAEIPGKGTMYRLQAGPVKTKEAASALCKKLAAAGQGCFIAK